MRSKIAKFLAAAFAAVTATALAACSFKPTTPPNTEKPDGPGGNGELKPSYSTPTFLKTDGELIKNTAGETVYLRGVNAGGLFVTEHWMTGFIYGSSPSNDYRSLTQTFIERFGEDQTKALWEEYRANWWTEEDFKTCAGMGINTIRLPFTYMNVDFAAVRDNDYADAGKAYDFSALDAFVETAASYGMYTILDLHGAYGSQNGQDHSGQVIGSASDVKFYTDARMTELTVKLWTELAKHYKNNPAVAAYDILNEPGEKAGTTGELHFSFYDKVYKAIRAAGDEHVVVFESCWDGKNLPDPADYGWENCMYSFHHYPGDKLSVTEHGVSWNDKIADVESRGFGVPLQMGEFTNYTSAEKWEYVLDLLNRSNWHWVSWTYKVWGNMPWGIVNIRGSNNQKVNAGSDEYYDILEKFKLLNSNGEAAKKYTFPAAGETEGKTLESIFRAYATAAAGKAPKAGEYLLLIEDKWVATGAGLELTDDYNKMKKLKITYSNTGDGSATLTAGGKPLYVSDNGVVTCGKTSDKNADLFYPVLTADGQIAFVSRRACKYVRLNGNTFTADADGIEGAALFDIGE